VKLDTVRRSLLALAEKRLGISFPARFTERWVSGVDVAGGALPSEWMRVDEMAWPGGEGPVSMGEGVGFPEDGSADFHCLLAERGRLSDIVHAWSHESRTFAPVEPWLGARAEGASWSEGELWEQSPVSRGSREQGFTMGAPPPSPRAEGSSIGTRPRERAADSGDALILAARIEDGALRGRADWAALLAPFNEATGASMSLQELRARGESDPASLVERLLLSRPPAVDPRALSRDAKFGKGVVVARDGTEPDAKLTIAFASGEKRLKASFVQIVDPGEDRGPGP
jgi:hypothetical protein